ncbi:MAG: MATE family efflux transporter, partial [Ignavibacteria bacterium]
MSLSEKVIKNTYYYFFSQVISLLMPLFLTPFIIMKIGDTQFGIYTLILGVLGTFGLLDLSLSTSFIKFISEYFHKNNIERLNNTVSTGFYIYLFFTIILTIIAFFSTDYLASVINIPADLTDTFKNTFRISLLIFFLSNAFGIFSTVLIVLQKMYITSIINVIFGLLNFISVIILLNYGFGLYGIIWSQAITMAAVILFTVIYSYRSLPQMK